jgi:succinate dehydrogenase / fumarate reductase cytochrome b subunit
MEIVLFAGILLHVFQGYALEAKNRSTRKQGYQVNLGERGSKWYSRSMGLLGTLLLLFLVLHIKHFWVPSRITGLEEVAGKDYHNLFAEMVEVFQNPIVVIIYVVGCISLAYHLMHGFTSAFRTLGVHNSRYVKLIRSIGNGFSILIPLVFASMPIAIYFGWVR